MRNIYAVAISLILLMAAPGLATADSSTSPTSRQQLLQYVISRGLSQRGVPFVWGGGNAAGPTRGSDPGADALGYTPSTGTSPYTPSTGTNPYTPSTGTVGFDASGLMVYSYAGAGIKLPRSSGEQYNFGRKVLPSQARPGDLIFYGPGGSQSVAMYLGNGKMLEGTEPAVAVSPVRTNGMAPYLVRIIET